MGANKSPTVRRLPPLAVFFIPTTPLHSHLLIIRTTMIMLRLPLPSIGTVQIRTRFALVIEVTVSLNSHAKLEGRFYCAH